jgi:membrane-associated phospholipid phosphatase
MLASLTNADRTLGVWLAAHMTGPWLDHVMLWATYIGMRSAIWIAFAILTWIVAPTKRMAAYRLLLSLALSSLIADGILKPMVGRDRPYVDHPEYHDYGVRPETASFPSGHAATSAAGALALTRIWPTPAVAIAAWTLAAVIAFSRVALGVHFPTDVLAGFAIGYVVARFVCARPPRSDQPAPAAATRVVQRPRPVL